MELSRIYLWESFNSAIIATHFPKVIPNSEIWCFSKNIFNLEKFMHLCHAYNYT